MVTKASTKQITHGAAALADVVPITARQHGRHGGQTVANLVGIVPALDGVIYKAVAYHNGYAVSSRGPVGGGTYVWSASTPKSQHNGGTIISPTVPWDGALGESHEAFLAGTGETHPVGNGCWVLAKNDGKFFIDEIGITTSNTAGANTIALQNLMDFIEETGKGEIFCGAGTYNFLPLEPKSGISFNGVVNKTVFKLDDSASSSASLLSKNADGTQGSLDDFSMHGIILDGNGRDAAFLVYGCNRLMFSECVFQNSGTYGAALQARPGFSIDLPQDDITFFKCKFLNNGSDSPGWDGLDIKWCTNAKIIGCQSINNTDVGINIRGLNVDIIGCDAIGNGTDGILIQSNDYTQSSRVRIIGGSATGTTIGNGLHIQTLAGNDVNISISGFHAIGSAGSGIQLSGTGAGKIYCTASSIESRGNTQHGVNVTGDYVGQFIVDGGLIVANSGNGVNNSGKNCVFSAVKIIGNALMGYRENSGANNNYIMPTCVISDNIGGDIGTRVGVETDDGFMSVRSAISMRIFPGKATGAEWQIDGSGNYVQTTTVGDAASVSYRITTKGNGEIAGYHQNGSRQLFNFRSGSSSSVNYPEFVNSPAGNPVQIGAVGTDTDIDLKLLPKGAGVLRFGSYEASSDVAISGYISIKDASGAVRKLAVIP